MLRELGGSLAYPASDASGGDIAARVAARVAATPPPSRRRVLVWPGGFGGGARPARRAAFLAVAAVLLIVVAATAAITLGLPGLRLIFGPAPTPLPSPSVTAPPSSRIPTTPAPTGPGANLPLGQPVDLAHLGAAADFPIRLPSDPAVGPPDAAWVDRGKGGQVSIVWKPTQSLGTTTEPGVGLLLAEFQGRVDQGFFSKAIGSGTTVEPIKVGQLSGFWISGDPHVFFWSDANGKFFDDQRRWVGDALIWSDGDVTYRLETSLGRDAAIRIAETLKPIASG